MRMHLLGYSYLILAEGVYDAVMRFLYALHLKLGIVTTEIKDIVARFTTDKVGLALLDAWNPTVRNAIGHATYFLDAQTQTIQFEDHRAHSTVNLTFDQFRELVAKMSNIGVAVSVLLIIRILIPLNLSEVSRVLGLS
jgi:hypothetical protein